MATSSTSTLRLLLRRSIRPTLSQRPAAHHHHLQPLLRSTYHSPSNPSPPDPPSLESKILTSALLHVPTHGFTPTSLHLGAKSCGYLDITASNLFPRGRGVFELILQHLRTQRLALASAPLPQSATTVPSRVRALILARLHANVSSGILPHLSQALGEMSLAENLGESLKELAALSDEILYLSGDRTVDGGWYTKRAGVGGVYASAELFQLRDQSQNFRETEGFVDRRLEEMEKLGRAVGNTVEWVGFQGRAVVGLGRSKGLRI